MILLIKRLTHEKPSLPTASPLFHLLSVSVNAADVQKYCLKNITVVRIFRKSGMTRQRKVSKFHSKNVGF